MERICLSFVKMLLLFICVNIVKGLPLKDGKDYAQNKDKIGYFTNNFTKVAMVLTDGDKSGEKFEKDSNGNGSENYTRTLSNSKMERLSLLNAINNSKPNSLDLSLNDMRIGIQEKSDGSQEFVDDSSVETSSIKLGFSKGNGDNLITPLTKGGRDVGYQMDGPAGSQVLKEPTAEIRVTVIKRSGRYWEPWELNYNVCPPSLCTAYDEGIRPRGTGGSVFYNGDIVLDKESEKIIFPNELRWRAGRRKRATMRSSRTWIGGVVPYIFAEDIQIENKTCINFRSKKPTDNDYIRFISEPGCWSSVGKVGGEQKVSIGKGCERVGVAIHEISHALGFWHEQARPDRDEFVKILEENVSPRYLPDFRKANPELVSSRGYPYDYQSIMHYSEKAFTNLGEKTITVIGIGKTLGMKIGQREELSNIDIAQLRDMYNCNDKEDDEVTACPTGWRKNGRSCYKFESDMAEQFSGAARHCEGLNSRLLHIDDAREDTHIKRFMKKKYPDVKVWRTGGRIVNGTFAWYTSEKGTPISMTYTKWQKGQPGSASSLALVFNRQKDRVRWQGVWLGSYSQLPEHAYPFICERRARHGRDYRGALDHTIDGYTCQKWNEHYPHDHALLPRSYNGTEENKDGLGDHNYCRNPASNRRSRPWCFTTKKKYTWQYCDVSVCAKRLQADDTQADDKNPKDKGSNKHNRRDLDEEKGADDKRNNKHNRRDLDEDEGADDKRNNKHNRRELDKDEGAGYKRNNKHNRRDVNDKNKKGDRDKEDKGNDKNSVKDESKNKAEKDKDTINNSANKDKHTSGKGRNKNRDSKKDRKDRRKHERKDKNKRKNKSHKKDKSSKPVKVPESEKNEVKFR
ncbi:ASTL-like protein [Mya arenaria]|uniref:Metalloendopeptidase n=1 Tax=Mya arenaria TaxID=6604 RepID=A0ABY7EF06_MYAAR|nr:ASTL-like protein [Mya arenaria]